MNDRNNKKPTQPINRRKMLKSAAAGVAALGMPGSALGFAANETINVGLIGAGGRCRHLLGALKKIPNVRITSVCDVWDENLNRAKELAEPGAFATKDHHDLLARTDVDAVLIASPDHWHVPMTVDACAAGKDVYVEKPLTHDLSEGQAVIDAQNEHQRIVQVGMQQRSMSHLREANEIIRSGQLGPIHKVHLTWNRNNGGRITADAKVDPKTVDWQRFLGSAKDQPFDAKRFRHWRWFWDFGGGILTDLMVHWVDVAHWFLDLDHAAEAVAIGDHFYAEGVWETPDTIQTLVRYPDQKTQVYFEGTFFNARNAAMSEYMGTQATLYLDRGRYEIHPEPKSEMKYRENILGKGRRGADFFDRPDGELLHLTNWVDCMRSRKRPNAPAEAGVLAVTGPHLGNRAYRTGQTARWESNQGA